MGLVPIFALIAILGAWGAVRSFKNRYFLATFWGTASFVVFAWFCIMTTIHHGVPISTVAK